eukprot:s950_g3.t1
MLEENKLVNLQPAYEPVQRMELKEEPYDLLEEEQIPGPERLKAEGKVDRTGQPLQREPRCRSIRHERAAFVCTVTDSCAETSKRSAAEELVQSLHQDFSCMSIEAKVDCKTMLLLSALPSQLLLYLPPSP